MVTPQLVEYIKNTLGRGYAEVNVRDALVKKGWKQADVDEAFRIAHSAPAATNPPQAQPAAVTQPYTGPTLSTPSEVRPMAPLGTGSASAANPIPVGSAQPAQAYQTQAPQMTTPPALQSAQTPPIQSPLAQSAYVPARQQPAIVAAPETPPRFQQPQTIQIPSEVKSPRVLVGSPEAALSANQAQTSQTENPASARRSQKTAYYIVGGVVLISAAYVFFGARYGLYAFGFNLFPFENFAKKIGIAEASPTPAPIPTPRQSLSPTPTPTPTPTPALTPLQPQVNGRTVSVYGLESEAGSIGAFVYSPEGQNVAYTRIADEQNLWVLGLADNSKESLLKTGQDALPTGAMPMVLAWSPDGIYIAAVVRGANGITNLYTIHTSSKTPLALTAATAPAEAVSADPMLAPKWSADSSWMLAYVGQSLWKISRDGSQKSRITPDLPLGSFDWSSDNAFIVYTVKRPLEENVWVMQSDGKNYVQLTFGGVNQMPRFSHDGLSIAYTSLDAGTSRDTLWSMSRSGDSRTQLAMGIGSIREFSWSPEGKHIAFIERAETGKQSLKIAQSDGSGLQEVLSAGDFEPLGFLSWDMDGNALNVAGSKKFLLSIAFRANEFVPAVSGSASPAP